MKPFLQLLALAAVGAVIAYLHPFHLVMPWQGGEPEPVNAALSDIMEGTDLLYVEADWGRPTPFNYVRATGGYEGRADLVDTCTDLRLRLDRWGRVTDIERREDGCDIEATGPGPMVATITVLESAERPNGLRVDIEVEHRS